MFVFSKWYPNFDVTATVWMIILKKMKLGSGCSSDAAENFISYKSKMFQLLCYLGFFQSTSQTSLLWNQKNRLKFWFNQHSLFNTNAWTMKSIWFDKTSVLGEACTVHILSSSFWYIYIYIYIYTYIYIQLVDLIQQTKNWNSYRVFR